MNVSVKFYNRNAKDLPNTDVVGTILHYVDLTYAYLT